ncbi:hypothetical protein C5E10_06305 [Pseudoclavibacter sp. RFBG4]|uniref:hypothetical protein n=1 Tax=Pseudoclavibacter sp. RFBG4 TaxID=2080575 RepID=UPI000CE85829|nr:hypothetical protein [Pseudoclavibacter sp. RFBG4]PPG35200.1 hypothetical protein C5E10_06305 [Pseudoclavibacter sp. RFBG4]
MNQLEALGLAVEAAFGKRIIVVTRDYRDNERAFEQVAASHIATGTVVELRRANGEQRIDFLAGGSIEFLTHQQRTDGIHADLIYLNEGVEPPRLHPNQGEIVHGSVRPPDATDADDVWMAVKNGPEHRHEPVQHRDGKTPWCAACGLDADYRAPRLVRWVGEYIVDGSCSYTLGNGGCVKPKGHSGPCHIELRFPV